MNDKDDEERGLVIRVLSSKDIQKGIAFFIIALILAFVAVTPVPAEERVSDEGIEETPHLERISYPSYQEVNATLEVSTTGSVNVSVHGSLGENSTVWGPKTVESGSETFYLTDIDSERVPRWLNFTDLEGNLTYTYTVQYSQNPYGLLSLPAAFFALLGMIFAFRGQGAILGEIKKKQMEEEARKKEKEREEVSDEEKAKSKEIESEVIYEREESEGEKGEADHINFMGLPDEENEEEKDSE
ncbi:MAG: hypothetical protein ACLFSM_02350 [Thermoplasmata archaeon]